MTASWIDSALCAQVDPDAWHPEKGGGVSEQKRICARCEVRTDCLAYALDNDERFGIWGGLSERERKKLPRSKPCRGGCGTQVPPVRRYCDECVPGKAGRARQARGEVA